MRDPAIQTFEDFWPFYVSQHRRHGTRVLHFVGTTLGLLLLARGAVASYSENGAFLIELSAV